jgi:two-component sensor histidine kinase
MYGRRPTNASVRLGSKPQKYNNTAISKSGTAIQTATTACQRRRDLQVLVNGGTAASAKAASLGLIVTELVINALKHAFPKDRSDGQVVVSYQIDGPDWKLVVSDNGTGKPDSIATPTRSGLGTTLVKALAQDLDAVAQEA